MNRRPDDEEKPRAKRVKVSNVDPKDNPYLAHRYEEPPKTKLRRHATTAAIARAAEDGPNNFLTGQPLSTQYFQILKTRRNLPVHAQRYVWSSNSKGYT
jgi:pre-mRNA-splicing factor ATP-dependent RNA helicase DHX15/PRP43